MLSLGSFILLLVGILFLIFRFEEIKNSESVDDIKLIIKKILVGILLIGIGIIMAVLDFWLSGLGIHV